MNNSDIVSMHIYDIISQYSMTKKQYIYIYLKRERKNIYCHICTNIHILGFQKPSGTSKGYLYEEFSCRREDLRIAEWRLF